MGEVIGFIGLGDMGRPMSANLARAGYEVIGFDTAPERQRASPHVKPAASVREVVAGCDGTTISIVRTLAQTEQVVEEVDRDGLTLLVMSTIDPTAMARITGELGARGVTVVDAPVSGGTAGAEAGTLAIMTAGPPGAVTRAMPVLEAVGKTIFQVGEAPGAAQAIKLANQLMLAVNMVGVYEGLKLASGYGMSAEQVLPVIAASTGNSWVAEHWDAVLTWWRDYQPGSSLDIINKDLRTLLADAAQHERSLPLAALAFDLLQNAWKDY